MEILHMLSGMPRSGSTLLACLLAQNPRIHSTETSGCMDMMFGMRAQWPNLIEHQASPPSEETIRRLFRGVLEAYHGDKEEPVIIDKCRGWLNLVETAEFALEREIKILVPVRDLRDVLASFEKLWQKNRHSKYVLGEGDNYQQFQSMEGRLRWWMRQDQTTGLAVSRIIDAVRRGYRDRMHFVDYDLLTQQPLDTMNAIYDFLGEDHFTHDFDNIEQVTSENDEVHGIPGLHTIQNVLKPSTPQYPKVLGNAVAEFSDAARFWESIN